MKFTVEIDDKVWARCAKALARSGFAGTPAEVLEAVLATAMTEPPAKHVGDTTISSTSVMLTLGQLKVRQEAP